MPIPTHSAFKRAIVAWLRANPTIEGAVKGIYEGFAPEKILYPFVVYNLAAAPYERNWGDATLIGLLDVSVVSRSSVEAENLDAVIAAWLEDAPLVVDGQTTLLCQREVTIPFAPDIDDEGKKVYQVGGTYHIETDVKTTRRVFIASAVDETTLNDTM